ncbi:LysM peptidoglycan-binding domain-containing protein [Eubacterium limosum]|uniref:LysM peptidoglycan-binding domain-containing protein n=1 Tax=Eubacterium limosum TaxID=1736 RepID=UPI001062591C|nr:LysM peptidoglycan-binding domain-containing protein [Eubacterium limosum]
MADNTQDMRKMGFEVGFNIYDDENGLPNLTKNIQKAVAESEKLTRSLSDVEKVTSSLSSSTAKTSETTEKASKAQGNFAKEVKDAWKAGTESAKSAMAQLKQEIDKLENKLDSGKLTPIDAKATTSELAKLKSAFSQIENEVKRSSDKTSKYSKEAYELMTLYNKQEIESRVRDAQKETAAKKAELAQQVKDYKASMQQLDTRYSSISSNTGSNFRQSLKSSILTGGVELLGVRALADAFENLGSQIISINYNTVNTQRIMQDFSEETANAITDSAIQIAKESGILVTDAQEIQAAWVRINDKYADSTELLNKISSATAKFMNVGEVEDAEKAVKLVNSSMLQFNMDVDEGIETLNKWAYMADKTALGTADEFGESAAKIGGFMTSVSGNMNDAIVMTSIVGDRLAKSGDEAGNSIKTILSYLTRTKTRTLFDDIAESTGDATYSLSEANGKFKDFAGLMDTVSRAYNMAMREGNDVLAKQIQEALGATRQGDVALTLLQNWTEEADKYYGMIEEAGSGSGSYLEQQNAALMTTFKNQWNSLYATIAEFGTVIANSGVLQGMTSIMNGAEGLLEKFNELPPAVQKSVVVFAELSIGIAVVKKLNEYMGVTEKLNEISTIGTASKRAEAEAIRDVTSERLKNLLAMQQEIALSNEIALTTSNNMIGAAANEFQILNQALESGEINAIQYTNACKNMMAGLEGIAEEDRNCITALTMQAAATKKAGEETKKKTVLDKYSSAASKEEAKAEASKTVTKKAGTKVDQESAATSTAETIATKSTTVAINEETAAKKSNIIATKNEIVQESKSTIANIAAAASEKAQAAAITIKAGAQELANKAMNAGKFALGALLSPLGLATAAFAAFTLVVKYNSEEIDRQQKKLDEANERYNELDSEINELTEKQKTTGLSSEELNRLDLLNKEMDIQKQIQEIEQKRMADLTTFSRGAFSDYIDQWKEAMNSGSSDNIESFIEAQNTKLGFKDYLNSYINMATGNEIGTVLKFPDIKNAIDSVDTLQGKYRSITGLLQYTKKVQSDILNDENTSNGLVGVKHTLLGAINGLLEKQTGMQDEVELQMLERNQQALTYRNQLQSQIDNGMFSGEKLSNAKEEIAALDEIIEKTTVATEKVDEYVSATENITVEGIDEIGTTFTSFMSELDNYINKVKEGTLSTEDLMTMGKKYDGFYDVLNAGAEEQLHFLEQIRQNEINSTAYDLEEQRVLLIERETELMKEIATLKKDIESGKGVDTTRLEEANKELTGISEKLREIDAIKNITIMVDVVGAEEIASVLNDLVSSTKQLTDAQQQLAYGTALSKTELFSLAMTYPELLYQANLFNEVSVEGQQAAINSVLDMKEQEFDAKIDEQIAELQAQQIACQNQLDLEQQKQDLLTTLDAEGQNARLGNTEQFYDIYGQYKQLEGENFVTVENGKVTKYAESEQIQADDAESGGEAKSDIANDTGTNVVGAAKQTNEKTGNLQQNSIKSFAASLQAALTLVKSFASKAWEMFTNRNFNIKDWFNQSISQAVSDAGKYSDPDAVDSNIYSEVEITPERVTIGGQELSDWTDEQRKHSRETIQAIKIQQQNIDNMIGNLEALKNLDLGDVNGSNDYYLKQAIAAQEKAAEAAEKAAKDAERAAEQTAQAIERIIQEYERNVESLQDRIVKALKKKYQEMYDERKKQLEKEQEAQLKVHNDRIDQLRDEIDKIKGDTPEDKQAELGRLQDELAGWMKDDSTLGKAKQKELMGKIKDLKQEIQIDDLEDQIDKEQDKIEEINNYFKQLLSSDSPLYDPVLKNIDAQMTNQALYAEANEMIRREQTQQIIDLLLAYDPDYSGIAQLMGQTAGQVIAMEVIKALNNYRDLRDNTITANGGKYTMSGGSGGSGRSSGSSVGSGGQRYHTVVGGDPWGDTLWDLAVHYYGDGSKWDKIYNANRDQVSDPDLIYPGQRLLIPFKTGGHTGSSEGVAYLDKKERVLTDQQTRAFDQMVFDFLPKINTSLLNVQSPQSGGNKTVNYDKELVSIKVDKVVNNTPFDIENGEQNLNKMFKKTLQKSGMNLR